MAVPPLRPSSQARSSAFARRSLGLRDDERAVTDVVGSVLLVSLTVLMAGALGALLLSFNAGSSTLRANLVITVDPGPGGVWGNGDEQVRIQHVGGDPLSASAASVVLRVGATATTLKGASQIGSAWGDGTLSVGETWTRTMNIPSTTAVGIAVVSTQAGNSQVVGSANLVSNPTSSTLPCATDHTPPTALSWTQVPPTITANTTGPVSVTVQLTDDCWGVNPNVTPDLYWRVKPASGAPAFTDQGAMTPVGSGRFGANVPAATWSTLVGQSVQVYAKPVADLGSNVGNTTLFNMPIVANCDLDATPPAVASFTQSPTDVTSVTSGAVTVTLVVSDNCAGVNELVAPTLDYRFNDGTNPTFLAVNMTHTATSTWTGTIPAQSWALLSFKTIDYFATGYQDKNHNVGTTTTRHDLVQAISTPWYVGGFTATTGTASNINNAKSDSDLGAEASLAEGANAAGTVTSIFAADSVVSSTGWTASTGTMLSAVSVSGDTNWANFANALPTTLNDLQVTVQDPPSLVGTVSSVQVKADVSINAADTNDLFQLMGCINGVGCTGYGTTSPNTGGVNAGTSDITITYDITALRPGGGSWTLTDVQNLQPVVHLIQNGNHGTWRVNFLYVQVSYISTTYSLNIRADWNTAAPITGTTYTLDLKYRLTGGDTFTVKVWNGTAFNARGSILDSTISTTWSYVLTAAELKGTGTTAAPAPRIQFLDNNPSSIVQATLFLDYARVDIV